MPAVAPLTADQAAAARGEKIVPSTQLPSSPWDQANKETLDMTHKASEVKHTPIGILSHFQDLDTVKDQMVPTKPITAIPGLPPVSTTAHGSVGDGTF